MEPPIRLFVAVDLDDRARVAIASEQQRIAAALGDARSSVKWVAPDRMHLTLVFLGEVPEGRAAPIVDAMTREMPFDPFDISFRDVGVFPERGAPKVVWIGVSRGRDELIRLQAEIARRLEPLGVEREPRPFQPHLTLGRWRESRGADRRSVVEAARRESLAIVTVDAATLYQSRISSAGPTYTVLARARLHAEGKM